MSRKIKRTVASTLALAMMAGTVSIMPASELTSIVQAVETGATVSVKMFDENQSTTVKPGDEFTVLCDVTDNTDGFSALVAWLSYNQDAFEMTSWNYATDNKRDPVRKNMGDPTDPENTSKYENPDKSIGTIVQLYDSTENLTGDTKLSKITFKVKAEAAAGDYEFSLGGDPVPQNGLKTACQNRNVPDDDDPKETKVIELLPNYVPLKVTVDSGNKPAVTTPAVTTPAPAETTPVPAQTTPAPAQTTVTTTAAEEPVGNGILVKIEDAKAEAGDEVELNVVVSNVGTGFSAVQFGYDMDASFKVTDAISDFGKWTVGKEERAAQFLEKNGNNITKECTLGQIYVDIPKGTPDGKYPVKLTNFKGSTYSTADKKQLTLEADAFSTVVGYIIVGDVPEETTPAETTAKPAETTPVSSEDPVGDGIVVKFKDTNVNAGEEAEISVMVSNAAAGFSAVQFGYDMDASFKITDAISDFGKWTVGKEERAAQFLEKNGNNITKDCELGTIYVEVPKGTPDGKYPVKLTNFKGSRYSTEEKKQLTLEADAFSTVVGYIIVGDVPEETTTAKPAETTTAKPAETTPAETTTAKPAETTPAETTTAKPAETTPAETTTAKPAETTPAATTTAKPAETTPAQTTPAPVETTPAVTTPAEPAAKGIKISASNVEDAKPGDEVKVEILAENVGKGFSAVQFTYDMEKTFVVSDAISELGKWTVGKKERALQFLQKDGNNITSDGAFGEVYIKIPENAKPGKYEIKLSGFKGSVYDKDANKQLTLENDSFETVTAYIVVKEGTPAETTTAKPAETTPAASETTPAATTTAKPAETTPAASETTPAASETTPAATTTAKPAETTPAVSETTPAVSETTPAVTTTTVQQPDGPVIGDVDDNGVVNTRDIVALKRYLLLVDDEAPKNGDLNGDKKIDSIDLVHLLRIFLK